MSRRLYLLLYVVLKVLKLVEYPVKLPVTLLGLPRILGWLLIKKKYQISIIIWSGSFIIYNIVKWSCHGVTTDASQTPEENFSLRNLSQLDVGEPWDQELVWKGPWSPGLLSWVLQDPFSRSAGPGTVRCHSNVKMTHLTFPSTSQSPAECLSSGRTAPLRTLSVQPAACFQCFTYLLLLLFHPLQWRKLFFVVSIIPF